MIFCEKVDKNDVEVHFSYQTEGKWTPSWSVESEDTVTRLRISLIKVDGIVGGKILQGTPIAPTWCS